MADADTKDRILDAAEHLYARKGYHSTSLREITGQAGVNLAAVNYHFGSKENLLRAILERRIVPLNEVRLELLKKVKEQAISENRRPGVRDIFHTFIEPAISWFSDDRENSDFMILVGRVHSDPDQTIRSYFLNLMYPAFHVYFETFCEAMPGCERETVFQRFLFAIGAMAHAIRGIPTVHTDLLPEGVSGGFDTKTLTESLVDFVTRGMEGG